MPTRIDQPPSPPPAPGQPRRTEEADTRQAIQRHDPEFYRKKKDESEQPGFQDPYEDLADVSVPALKNFLLGLLDRIAASGGETGAPSATDAQDTPRPAASPQTAAALSAYQAGARRGSATPPPPPPVASAPPASALDQAAAGLDRTAVLDLIRDLDRLYSEGITAIALEKGEGFLASIRAGIDRARGAP
jgi:hypothetical protein